MCSATLIATPAAAVDVITGVSTDRVSLPTQQTQTFNSAAGTGTFSFVLNGFNSVDGVGAVSGGTDFSDLFSVSLNGSQIYSGYLRLGGLGTTSQVSNSGGFSVVTVDRGFPNGGTATFTGGTAALLDGTNTLTFQFTNTPQSFADESYSITALSVVNQVAPPVAAAVPEPASWAMMIAGFGLVGGAARRRRSVRTTVRFA